MSLAGLDLFGSPPFEAAPAHARSGGQTAADDPFGMPAFSPAPHDLDLQIANGNKDLMEVQVMTIRDFCDGAERFSPRVGLGGFPLRRSVCRTVLAARRALHDLSSLSGTGGGLAAADYSKSK